MVRAAEVFKYAHAAVIFAADEGASN